MKDKMKNYYFTFGVKYGTDVARGEEPHPSGEPITGKHYVRVVARSCNAARELIFARFGRAWAFVYDSPPEPPYAPLGEFDVMFEPIREAEVIRELLNYSIQKLGQNPDASPEAQAVYADALDWFTKEVDKLYETK